MARPGRVAAGQPGQVEPLGLTLWLETPQDGLTCDWLLLALRGSVLPPKRLLAGPHGSPDGPRSAPAVLTDRGVLVWCLCSQSAAPFLHLLALACVTAGSWFVAGYGVRRHPSGKSRQLVACVLSGFLLPAESISGASSAEDGPPPSLRSGDSPAALRHPPLRCVPGSAHLHLPLHHGPPAPQTTPGCGWSPWRSDGGLLPRPKSKPQIKAPKQSSNQSPNQSPNQSSKSKSQRPKSQPEGSNNSSTFRLSSDASKLQTSFTSRGHAVE